MNQKDAKRKLKRALHAALAMWETMMSTDKFAHRLAVKLLRSKYGEEFIYQNRNDNPAIDRRVLAMFNLLTQDVVWAKDGRYWRHRRAGDPLHGRQVSF